MLRNNKIAVVVPCFNEDSNIAKVINTMPNFVDLIVVVDDASTDKTIDEVKRLSIGDSRIHLLTSQRNGGVGSAISKGCIHALEEESDVVAVMAGDGQMDPEILEKIIWPIILDEVDFTKTNRLFDMASYSDIPKHRFIGNFILSLFTKIASGYWKISDAQSGYTAINKKGLSRVDWKRMYPRYGQPNDLLITLNILNLRVGDIFTPPRYGVGEKSKMKIHKVLFTIPPILWKGFWKRLWLKYVVRNSHPLVILYISSVLAGLISIFFFGKLFLSFILDGDVPQTSAILFSFSALFSLQSLSFAMWFDLQYNESNQKSYILEDIFLDDAGKK